MCGKVQELVSLLLLCGSVFGLSSNANALDITLDANQPGRTFEGIGAVSAGASSRLLVDYPEPQRSQILDYLFKPGFGAALQHLKVEIGGEVNSTDGTEPTHMRSATDHNYTRGYEWWLMQQAKARNPGILLDCLAWGAPGWIGNGNYYSQDMCNYIVDFIKGAKSQYGLTFDYTGTHNEAAVNAAWIVQLRSTLDANGLQGVKLVAADEWNGAWNIVTNSSYGMLVNPALSNAVARIGAHYPHSTSPNAAQACGTPLWSSEDGIGGSSWAAARKLGAQFNRNYATGKMTKTEIWSPITSYYDNLPAHDSGLMRANTPWSGSYTVAPAIWATAHTTQFAWPGWRYLEGGASALLPAGGSVVTLLSTNNTDYSVVVETFDATATQTITFHLTNGLAVAPLNVWRTTQANYFEHVGTVTPSNGLFTITFQPESIYSVTTTAGQSKGNVVPPAGGSFPLPYKDDFEAYSLTRTPKYLSDQAGTFETAQRADEQGKCLRQVLAQQGIRWTAEWYPYTLLGESNWSDYDVSAQVLIETNNGFAFVMGRIGKVPGFSDATPRCYWLSLNKAASKWELHAYTNLIASGSISIPANTWHSLRLSMQGPALACYVDGAAVTNVTDYAYSAGLAGMGCGWHGAQFDDFTVRRFHRADFNLAPSATAIASSYWQDDPAYAPSNANDGDLDTRWNTAYPTLVNEWLELDFPSPVTFNHTICSQYDTRISGYKIQHWTTGGWLTDFTGGAMGATASDTFPAVTSSRMRVLLTSFTSSPSLYEVAVYNDSVPPNLALSGTATASSTWSSGYMATLGNDNDSSTRWNAGVGTSNNQWLQIEWPAATTFNRTGISQFGDRITSYKIQHWNGSAWVDDIVGGQPGLNRVDNFTPVTSMRARLLVTTATNVPSIWEFQIYNDPPPLPAIAINEWMTNNVHAALDPAGGYHPWFELYNGGATNVNVGGFYLGSSLENLFQFQIPSGYSIPAHDFLTVWADGQTAQNLGGANLHVDFSLAEAQMISLSDSTGRIIDAVDLPEQAPDTVLGCIPDGDPAVLSLAAPTPGASNKQIWSLAATVQPGDGAAVLRFAGIPFAAHQIFAASNLFPAVWTNLGTRLADGLGIVSFVDSNAASNVRRFYRAGYP